MKSTILIIAILAQVLLGKVILNAQTSDSVYKARINYIFAQVNHSKVTTGLLFDYGLHLIPPQYYNGVLQDSNEVDIEIWKTLYSGIYGCKFNNLGTALATPQAVYGLISQNTPTADVTIPIAAMAIEYEKLRDDAITASLVKVVNDQIVEISTVSPYEKKILFAACPVKTELEASTVTFTFGSTLLKTNYPYTVTTIKADMGDGSGLQTVVNGSKTVTYPVSGIKHFTIQYTFSNGKVLNTHGNFMVDFESTLKASTIYSVSFQKTVDIPANSKHSGGTLFIRYGAKHEIAQKLRKPFIVVEGYDPFWAIGYGSLTIKQFLYDDSENKSLYSIFTKTTGGTLASELYNNDYDIIYLDYNRGTDDIRRNAALLEDALDKINNELKEPYSDANVVMGISMGGLVARYALRKMELAGKNHDSQLFFTMDTPHKGANVPLGYQKVISSLYNSIIDLNVPMLDKAIKLMNEPATKQLLIYQDNSSTDHNVFFNELETMGLPQNTTNIALSNGSGYGSLTFAPNTELFKFTYDYKFNFLEGTAYAYLSLILGVKSIANLVPGRTDLYAEITINALNTNANRVYQNHIWITKKILWFIPITNDLYYREAYAPAGCLPLDGAPGGKYSTSVFLSGDIPDEFKSAIKEEAFCFIPTTSALGLKDWGTYLTSDLSPYNLITNGQCPFDEYFTGMPTTNQVHTDFRTPPTLGNYIASSIKSKTVPSIPQSLEGSASTNNIVLTWDDASYNETGFEIQRSLDPVTGFTTVANIGTDIETYTDNGANNSKVYYYRIRSSNSFGNSEWVYNSNMSCSGAYKITTTQSFSNTIFFPCGFEVTSGAVLSITSSVIVPNDKDILVSSGATLVLQNGASIINTEGGVWTGNFIVNTNGELNINTGYSYIKTAGNIDFSNSGKLTVNGALTISGALLINGTNGIFTLNGVLNITNTTLFNLSNIAAFNGTINAGNSVNLVIESGKTIDLTSGKAINISNSGILTINGSLTMNGGTFSKNGTSKLYLNGALNFSPFYTFTIDCYTELNGTINVPANFSLTFSGSNKSTVLLNVKKSFVFDADLATLTIQNGKIIMDNSTSELYFNNGIDNINLNNIWVTSSTGANNGHQGIDIRSDGNISVTNSKFEQGYYGVYASRAATAPNLNITISTFKNNAYGLRVYNSGVTIDGSTFESNTAMGIYSTSMDKSSSITNSTIRYQNGTGDYGVYYEGVSTAGLTFVSNGINSNYNGVSLVGGFNAVFKCNTISANSNSGVSAQNNGAIFLANAAGITGGNNDMHSNKIALSGSGTTQYFNSFYLNNGYNDLRDNGVSGSYCMSGQFGAFCGGAVAANNNYWKTGGGAPVDGVDYLLYGGCTNPDNPILFARLQVTDNSPENSFTLCSPLEEPGPLSLNSPYGADATYRAVTTDLGTQPLNVAVEEILNTDAKQGTVYDLTTQYGLLGQVLTNNLNNLNAGEAWYAKHSYQMLKSQLGKFGKQEGTDKVNPELTQKMLQVIRKLQTDDNQGNGNNNGKKHNQAYFSHAMDEAEILWLEKDYEGAITLLQKLAKKADADQLCEIQKLICQIEIDREFIASGNTLEIEELLAQCTECSGAEKSGNINSSGGSQENVNPANELNLEQTLGVVPNPVTGNSEIRVYGLQQAATLVVYNSTGLKVIDESIVTSSYSRLVSNTDLPAGIYLVTLNVNGTVTQTLKMVVVK